MTTQPPEGAAAERRALCRAHREIDPLLGQVEALAEMSGSLADPALEHALRGLLDLFAVCLLPHFDWEDETLLREAGPANRTTLRGGLLCQQHAQIRQGAGSGWSPAGWRERQPTHRQLADLRARLRTARAARRAPRTGGARSRPRSRRGDPRAVSGRRGVIEGLVSDIRWQSGEQTPPATMVEDHGVHPGPRESHRAPIGMADLQGSPMTTSCGCPRPARQPRWTGRPRLLGRCSPAPAIAERAGEPGLRTWPESKGRATQPEGRSGTRP